MTKEKETEVVEDGVVAFGEPIKAISTEDDRMKVASYGIRFGSEGERDLEH